MERDTAGCPCRKSGFDIFLRRNTNGTGTLAIARAVIRFSPVSSTRERCACASGQSDYRPEVYLQVVIPFNDPSVSSFAKGVLAALPASNVPGNPFSNNYASLPADTINDDKGDVRVDQTFSAKTTAFVRYSQHQGKIASPPNIQGPAGGNSNGNVNIFNQQIAGGVTRSFNQNSILDARFAFTRTDGGKFPYGQHLPSLMAGIPGLPTDPQVVRSLNVQSVSGFSQFGNQGSNPQYQNPYIFNPKVNFTPGSADVTATRWGMSIRQSLRRSMTSIQSMGRILTTVAIALRVRQQVP